MALEHHPKIVTNGLIFYIDTANTRSYSGSGTTVYGLVSGTNVTLTNGVGFGTTNTNYFIFDGANDNIPFSLSSIGNTLTVEFWARIKAFNGGMIFGFNRYDVWTSNGNIGFNTAQSDQYGITSSQVTNLGLLNQWKHYIFEMRSDVAYTNNKIYINSENQSLTQIASSENSTNRNFNSGNGRISSWLFDNNYNISMDLAQFRVYSRALTATEVIQNYNSSKKRFGL
jgi:hypothetical protein